ncbi:MAG: prepilin peptidase [Sulfuricurvum sp. PD_MW2]|jgi:leader peptidase (prepilin peptidase)/N-methyltransferase|uniref:prepilin peptidase n=1 Tax=Sulfuricurvum sp. PD_MW2 TaxID=2027917 RepID=UPI000C0667E6|nr:A24 family peptidase [Sulfuricurvum sp. PD_MW2]PHM17975.1 MAG: prepilin peptidase [Sulfuricurvum sp. PD_MW2]
MELLFVFIFGALIGSFLNVVIIRIPRDESIAFPASHCMHCNTPLKVWHNVPVISWLMLRGKCAFCGEKISLQYPMIELFSALIFLFSAMKFGFTLQAFGIALTFDLLLALSAIDYRYKMVPDSLNLGALSVAVFSVTSFAQLGYNITNALLFAGGFSLLRFYVSYIIKKEAMGEADIMIAATMGALLGIKLGLVAIFFGAVLALPALVLTRDESDESKELPFIPFLAMGCWIVLMFDSYVNNYLVGIYG